MVHVCAHTVMPYGENPNSSREEAGINTIFKRGNIQYIPITSGCKVMLSHFSCLSIPGKHYLTISPYI